MNNQVCEALKITSGLGTKECEAFRHKIFKAHEYLALSLAKDYAYVAKKDSYIKANIKLNKLHNKLTLGKGYQSRFKGGFQGIFIDSPDEDIKLFSEQRSKHVFSVFCDINKRYGFTKALKQVIKELARCDLTFPHPEPLNASKEEITCALARVFDPHWWHRSIRSYQDLILESVQIELGKVNKKHGIYSSNHCLKRKINQWRRNELILSNLVAESDAGDVLNLLDVAKTGVADLTNRRNELMTRMSGTEEYSKKHEHQGLFVTLTAPSKYHSYLTSPCIPNPKYKGHTPKQTQEYLNNVWQRVRAKLKRLNVDFYGLRVAEPHHDGTPHWHILIFAPKANIALIKNVISEHALKEDGNEHGAKKHRVTYLLSDPSKGSATGYMAKYIAKNIDGKNVGADEYGFDAINSALRTRAWASNWKIRQFQFFGLPSVTVWRESRRIATQELELAEITDDKLNEIIEAADTGDWLSFMELLGGANMKLNEQPLRAFHIEKNSPNKYGEAAKKILGMIYEGLEVIVTRTKVWKISSKAQFDFSQQTDGTFCSGGANAPPLGVL